MALPKDENIRERVISYIKENDASLSQLTFDSYSLTELIVIKTEIELKMIRKKNTG
jgi:hypothetical protein